MSFIEPSLLWGALAVAIPVAIHFWHQKQGKLLLWAATQWLTEKQQQQSRGFRFDNLLLLIIRGLLLILLAILLAQPVLDWFTKPPVVQKVHLVQPSASVVSNFRFELTDALKQGERVVWANERLQPVNAQLTIPQPVADFRALGLQTAINQLDSKNTELHLYASNNQKLADVPTIAVPARFRLHTVIDSARQPQSYLIVKNNKRLFIDRAGKLTSNAQFDPTLRFRSAPAYSGPMRVLFNYRTDRERRTVKAALLALTEIYSMDLQMDERPVPNRQYRWVLTDQLPTNPSPQALYIISDVERLVTGTNIVYTNETLTPQTSERVETGQLPEWLGEQLLTYYGLAPHGQPLSRQDLPTLFVSFTKPSAQQQAGIQPLLLLVFISLVVVERWLSLTKNA